MSKSFKFIFCFIILVSLCLGTAGAATLGIEVKQETYPNKYVFVNIYAENLDFSFTSFSLFVTLDQNLYSLLTASQGSDVKICGLTQYNYESFSNASLLQMGHDIGSYTHGVQIYGELPDTVCLEGKTRINLVSVLVKASDLESLFPHECEIAPISFFWRGCNDNILISPNGQTIAAVFEAYTAENPGQPVTGSFPGFGAPGTICNVAGISGTLTAYNGGFHIPCPFDFPEPGELPGDINLNTYPFETDDNNIFANYFIYGLNVFNLNTELQVIATDINQDGIFLTVTDFIWMRKVMLGEPPPYDSQWKATAKFNKTTISDGNLISDDFVSAAVVWYTGNSTPQLLDQSADMRYNYDERENLTKVLIYSNEINQSLNREILHVDGQIVMAEVANQFGASKVQPTLPSSIQLNQNYPNPFNPTTTIEFRLDKRSDWKLEIVNIQGQVVRIYSGTGIGNLSVQFDVSNSGSSNIASGLYLYRLTSGETTLSKKMLLLK